MKDSEKLFELLGKFEKEPRGPLDFLRLLHSLSNFEKDLFQIINYSGPIRKVKSYENFSVVRINFNHGKDLTYEPYFVLMTSAGNLFSFEELKF